MGFVAMLLALAFVNEEATFLGGYGAFAWLNDLHLGNFDGGALLAMGFASPLGFAYAIVSVAAQTVLKRSRAARACRAACSPRRGRWRRSRPRCRCSPQAPSATGSGHSR